MTTIPCSHRECKGKLLWRQTGDSHFPYIADRHSHALLQKQHAFHLVNALQVASDGDIGPALFPSVREEIHRLHQGVLLFLGVQEIEGLLQLRPVHGGASIRISSSTKPALRRAAASAGSLTAKRPMPSSRSSRASSTSPAPWPSPVSTA